MTLQRKKIFKLAIQLSTIHILLSLIFPMSFNNKPQNDNKIEIVFILLRLPISLQL